MEELEIVLRKDCMEALTMHVTLEKDISNDRTYTDNRNSEYSPAYRTTLRLSVMFSVLIVILCLCSGTSAVPSALLCHMKCLHGGKLHVPDGPFGFCMCNCPRGYVGLRCEFNKRQPPRRLRRVNRLKRLVKLRNEVEGMLTAKRRHRHYKS